MDRPVVSRAAVRRAGLFVGLAACYLVAGRLSLRLAFVSPTATPVWPPSGIAIAALALFGLELWPAITLAAFAVAFGAAPSVTAAAGIALGNTCEAVIGAYAVRRWGGPAAVFRDGRALFAFIVLAAGGATAVSAGAGTLATVAGGGAPWSAAGAIWFTWWLGDAAGALLVAPLAFAWAPAHADELPASRIPELALVTAVNVIVAALVFGPIPVTLGRFPLQFLCLPPLLWAAFRFGPKESTAALVAMAIVAVGATAARGGAVGGWPPNAALLLLQGFIAVAAVTTLTLATAVRQRREAEAELRRLAVSDPLTGLANYRHLMDVLTAEIQRFNRTARPFAVLFFDLDHLKRINDRHGHLVGSRALCRVADALRATGRVTDTAARYGGDEFAVVLPETDETAALQAGRRVAERVVRDGERPPLEVSFGVAVCPRDGTTPELLLDNADRVLYEMKRKRPSGPSGRRRA